MKDIQVHDVSAKFYHVWTSEQLSEKKTKSARTVWEL